MFNSAYGKSHIESLTTSENCTRKTVMQHSSIQHIYTLPELKNEINVLRRTFHSVRLVSPAECRVLCMDEDKISLSDNCHSVWRRSSPCEYCLSLRVLMSHGTDMKTEFIDGRFFLVLAKYVLLEGKEFSLEMISEVTDPSGFGSEDPVFDEISRLEKENSRLMRDPLTNCYSRHYLNENFQHYARVARNRGQDLCIALFDMDNFKGINDRYGHAIGDAVLQSCCSFWLKYFDVPSWGFLTRYGGDEFVIVSMVSSYKEFCFRLVQLAGSMRKTIVMPDGSSIPFSFTMGCASMRETHILDERIVWNAMLPLADQRMYQGKSAGRNCIVTGLGGMPCYPGERGSSSDER